MRERSGPAAASLAAPVVAYAGFEFVSRILLPPFLTGPVGLSFQAAALVIFMLRCVDVAGDVVLGALCDQFGRRKAWMLAGAAVAAPATMVLALSAGEMPIGLAVFATFAALIGWSAVNAAQSALSLEAGEGLIQRGRVFAWRSAASIAGLTLLAAVTSAAGGDTARQMLWTAFALLASTPLLLALAFWRVAERSARAPRRPPSWLDVGSTIGLAWANARRARVATLFALAGAHASIWATGFAYTIQHGLDLPSLLGPAVLVQAFAAVVAAFLWSRALARISAQAALALIFAGEVVFGALAFALPAGEAAPALAWVGARGLVAGAELMVLRAITGDFLDEAGGGRAAGLAASFHFPFAISAAAAGSLLLWLLHIAGFDPEAGGRIALLVTAGCGAVASLTAFIIASAGSWSAGSPPQMLAPTRPKSEIIR